MISRRRQSRGSHQDLDETYSTVEDDEVLEYYDCINTSVVHEGLSKEELERLQELRTEIILIENQVEEMTECIRQEEQFAQKEASKHREELGTIQERGRSLEVELNTVKLDVAEARKRYRELCFASLACRMLVHQRSAVELQVQNCEHLVTCRDQLLEQLRDRVLDGCPLAEASEAHSRQLAELEDLRRGGIRWQQQLCSSSSGKGVAAPSEPELRRCLDRLAQRREEQQTMLRSQRAEVSKMQEELKARAENNASCANAASAASTSAGTTPRQHDSEASASTTPTLTPRASSGASGKGQPPAGQGAGGKGLPPALPAGKGKGAGKGGGAGPASVFAPKADSGPGSVFAPKADSHVPEAITASPGPAPKAEGQAPAAPTGSPKGGQPPAVPPPMGKALGKGPPPMGKASGKGAPPAKATGGKGLPSMGKAKAASMQSAPRSNGLVNVTWKALGEPKAVDLSLAKDKMLGSISEFLDPDFLEEHEPDEEAPAADTVYAAAAESANSVFELSSAQLQDWFRAVPPSAVKSASSPRGAGNAVQSASGAAKRKTECLLDDKAVQKVSILLQRFKMKNSSGSSGTGTPRGANVDAEAVVALRTSILSCKAPVDLLEAMHEIVTVDSETCQKVAAFVKERGANALSLCSPEAEHRLLHVVCQVPNVSDRLQCLIFEAQWPEAQRKCTEDLQVLLDGMKVLTQKRDCVKKLFQTALHLGNALNKDSYAPIATRGFRLSSLPKLLQLRCSAKNSLVTLLHMALALLEPSEVKVLVENVSKLAAAKDRKSYGVHQRCQELLNGLLNIERLSKSVPRQMRKRTTAPPTATVVQTLQSQQPASRSTMVPARSTMVPASAQHRRRSPGPMAPEAALRAPVDAAPVVVEEADPDDVFLDRMQQFLDHSRTKARYIAKVCKDVFDCYWELAYFFEDPDAVYPPPSQKDTDTTEDIFALFHRFLVDVVEASEDVTRLKLREEILVMEAKAHSAIAAETPPPNSVGDKPMLTPRISTNKAVVGQGSPMVVATVKRNPSPAPALDATALRRLREARAGSVTRAGSASRGPASRFVNQRSARFDDEDDGEQSDVSDWEASPRNNKKTGCVAKARPRPSMASPPPKAAASPPMQTAAVVSPPMQSVLEAKRQADNNHSACPPRRSVRRPTSASPSPAGRSAGAMSMTPGLRDRAYVLPNASATTAVAQAVPSTPVAANASASATPMAVISQSKGPSSPRPTVSKAQGSPPAALGPPPARRPSEAGTRKSMQPTTPVRGISAASMELASMTPTEIQPLPNCGIGLHVIAGSNSLAHASASPPQRPPPQKPVGHDQLGRNRKSLSVRADRLSLAVVSNLIPGVAMSVHESDGSDMDIDKDEDDCDIDESPERPWLSQRRVRSSSRSSSSASPSPEPQENISMAGKPPRKSLTAEVQDAARQFRRRSLSHGPQRRTPQQKPKVQHGVADLTPVAEPGETPQTGSGYPRGSSVDAASGDFAAGSPMMARNLSSSLTGQ